MTADEIVVTLETAAAQRESMIDALLAVAAAQPVPEDAVERLFDRDWYLATYPDIAAAGVDPLAHFLEHPAERRNPNALFDSTAWAQERELDEATNALADYVAGGAWKAASTRAFVAAHPDQAAAGVTPVAFAQARLKSFTASIPGLLSGVAQQSADRARPAAGASDPDQFQW